jgi:hypothetical protein
VGLFSRSGEVPVDHLLVSKLYSETGSPKRFQLQLLGELQEVIRTGAKSRPIEALLQDGVPTNSRSIIVFTDDFGFRASKNGASDRFDFADVSGVDYTKPNDSLFVMTLKPSKVFFGVDGHHKMSHRFCETVLSELISDARREVRNRELVVFTGSMDKAWFDRWIDHVLTEIGMDDEYFSRTGDAESVVGLYKKLGAIVHHYSRKACDRHGPPGALEAVDRYAKSDDATLEGTIALVERHAPTQLDHIRREVSRFAAVFIKTRSDQKSAPQPIRHDFG